MVPLIISNDGAVHKDTVMQWKDFAHDIKIDWVRIAQCMLRYNVVIVGKFFNKGNWVADVWMEEHLDEKEEEPDGPPEMFANAEEKRELLHLNCVPESAVCVCGLRAGHVHIELGLRPLEWDT